MEAKIRGGNHRFYTAGPSDMNELGKKSLEWNLNDWKWDGDLFVASPLNAVPSDCRNKQLFPIPSTAGLSNSSSSCSDETDFGILEKGKGESEKRRRIVVVEDEEPCNETGSLTLKLGGHAYPIAEADLANWEGKNGKRSKLQGGISNRSICQVEGCRSDLSDAKDYHRRHKVCEMHAKASKALVGNVMQRFCQQCSRFHLLQEFDEGKRSCRRRLAGHNRRRRKTHPDATVNGSSLTDDRASSYLLISLLRILSNLHSDSSDQSKDPDLLSHLLRNLANLAGPFDARNLSGLLQASQDLQKPGTSGGTFSGAANALLSNGVPAQESSRPICSTSKLNCITSIQGPSSSPVDPSVPLVVATVGMPSKKSIAEASLNGTVLEFPSGRAATLVPVEDDVEGVRLKDFDLNNTYNDTQDYFEGCEKSVNPANLGTGSFNCPSWMLQDSHQSSPPQTSGNSDSASAQSLSSSNGDAQGRTDRIVFKLFGKDPNDFPLVLRAQILDWLSHSPSDIESYIRPGCVILTVYLRLAEAAWEELGRDLCSSLNKLLYVSGDEFWRTGWVFARVQHRVAFIYNGQVVLDTPLLPKGPSHCNILCVTPIAVSVSARVNFTVKGYNLARSTVRLLCAFEGKYLVQETAQALVDGSDTSREHEGSQCLNFSCSIPNATGRGFIEVEDHGLSSGFFPFIVAEADVCSEIRMLESAINVAPCDDRCQERNARSQALDFLHEMGWLLRRSHLRSISAQRSYCPNVFPLARFRWLMAFAMDREWCAVVKKLLDILFSGSIDADGHSAVELALSENLLHNAVRKNCRPLVELLLRYSPDTASNETGPDSFLFRPDILGPSNITPLHVAASSTGMESVLGALTDDPGQVGIKAWKNARDSTGFTPEDYARSRGYESYIDLVQKKINKKLDKGHVVLDIPGSLSGPDVTHKESDGPNSSKLAGFQIDKSKLKSLQQQNCKLCTQQRAYRSFRNRSLLYRPAMLSMVGIAAVCVCVGLLFKGPPEVLFVYPPFSWDLLGYGSM